jgi:alpha-beta hydrolase superfamily lysophospholipase
MIEEVRSFTATDGKEIIYHRWLPDSQPVQGVAQIIHGMAEHSLRYRWFAAQLTERGYAVYADDHRGHGKTAGASENVSHLESGDADRMISDQCQLSGCISIDFPAKPLVLFAHSMGSFIGRCLLAHPDSKFHAAIICGTAYKPALLRTFAQKLSWAQMKLLGPRHRSRLLDRLSFGDYNRFFEKRTPFDWLSRDQKEVDAFLHDPRCGVLCSTGFFFTLFTLIARACNHHTIDATPRALPLLFIAGDQDPVGGYGTEVRKLHRRFQQLGFEDTSLKIYPGARHELINETNRDEVAADLIHWLASRSSWKKKAE